MIHKLSKVGKDKEAWKKAEEYLTQIQEDDHMLTLEDTELSGFCLFDQCASVLTFGASSILRELRCLGF